MPVTAAPEPRTKALTKPAHEAVKEVVSVENIITMATTSINPIQGQTSACAMPSTIIDTGYLFGLRRSDDATGLATVSTTDRARTEVAAKGHVAFVAIVPGTHAWSPPIC